MLVVPPSLTGAARGVGSRPAVDLSAFIQALSSARVYDLEQPRFYGAPVFPTHEPGFHLSLHRRHEPGTGEARTGASALVVMAEHSGTHIDALCHQAENMEMFGGVKVDAGVQTYVGFTALGVETIEPIVKRGVLLDAAGHAGVERLDPGAAVQNLEQVASDQQTVVGEGDVVLVRTGNGALWESRAEYEGGAGIGIDSSRWLAGRRPFAVGADNLAWDVPGHVDPDLGTIPGHSILIVRAGIHIIESLNLERLARDRRHEFVFVCLPLKIRGGTGSPVRPLALVPA